jgi:D-glycerate 3-kinase
MLEPGAHYNSGRHLISFLLLKSHVVVCSDAVKLPRYDKSAFGGAGDRADPGRWPTATPPISVVLFEGWMLGFRPVGESAAAAVDPSLPQVDRQLCSYQDAWDSFVHAWMVVEIADAAWVFNWRLQAEQQMKKSGKDGMSDEQVQQFVARYMPAYKAYLPELYAKGPTTAQKGRCLFVQIDQMRNLVAARAL